jgi:recombination protein RecT
MGNALATNASTDRALAHQQQQAQPPAVAAAEPKTFVDLLEQPGWRDKMAAKLPASMTIDRLKGVVIAAQSKQPLLLRCTPISWYQALTECATYDLWPGAQGHGYLIPYGNKRKGPDGRDIIVNGKPVWDDCVQFQLGYRGMIDLGYRSGLIEPGSFQAAAVYEADEFDLAYGSESFIKHKPKLLGERGQLVGFYAVCRPKDSRPVFDVMRKDEVDAIRARSKSANSGPWVTDYNAMGMKTVLRRFWKMLPSSVTAQFADLIERDQEREFDLAVEERAKKPPRPKIASLTGEVKERKPEWSAEQTQRQGSLVSALYKLGERVEAETNELIRRMKYDEPEGVLDALDDLLEHHQAAAPEAAPAGAAPAEATAPKTLDDARALIQRMIKELGDDQAGAIIDPLLDEFAVEKLPDLRPELIGEFTETLATRFDEFAGRA